MFHVNQFILFKKYLLNAYCISGTFLGSGNAINKTEKDTSSWEVANNREVKKQILITLQ